MLAPPLMCIEGDKRYKSYFGCEDLVPAGAQTSSRQADYLA